MKVTARARRSGEWWAIEVPEVEGVFTQAKRLDQVAATTADAVATMLDIDPSEVEVVLSPRLPNDVMEEIVVVARATAADAAELQARASREMREAVRVLRDERLTSRDVAMLLGITHQRVSQLEKSAR